MRLPQNLFWAWAGAAVLGLAACRTVPQPPLPTAGLTRSGQMSYQGEKRFIAEFVLRQNRDDFDLELFKNMGAPLLTVRVVGARAWVGGALAGHGWSGQRDGWIPKAAAGWVGLADVFARLPAAAPGWRIEPTKEFGKLRRVVAIYEASGETFDFRFE